MRANTFALLGALTIGVTLSPITRAQAIYLEGASAGSEIGRIAAEEFRKVKGAGAVVTGVTGSEAALTRLCAGQIDVANTARPALKEELSACAKAGADFVELPIALDSVVIVVNGKNAFVQGLTLEQLRLMWGEKARGKIVRWSQVDPRFPDKPLKLLGPDPHYERDNIFTEAVLGHGQAARTDAMTSVDDRILIQAVARDIYASAYMSYATFVEQRGSVRSVPIAPNGTSTGSGELALSRPLFLYARVRSLQRPEVRQFVEFALANGESIARAARYQPLTPGTYELGIAHVKNVAKGSAWDGAVPVGVTPRDVERRMGTL